MLNLYGLKYFYDSCRLSSMSKAADFNCVSRPAVSQAIKKLEEEMGVKLLSHKRRSFEPTRAGLLLAQQAALTFAHVERIDSILKGTSGKLHGTLRLGSIRTLVNHELKNAIYGFREQNDEVDIKIRIYNSRELMTKLADKELDLVVLISDDTLQDHKQVIIKSGSFCLIKPKALKEKDTLYAVSEPRLETERLKTLFERQFGKQLPIYAEVHSWDAIWNWAQAGLCGGLIPDFLLSSVPKSSAKTSVVLDKIWPYEIKAVFAETRKNDPLITAFLASIKR